MGTSEIYYVNTTLTQVTSGSEKVGSESANAFIRNISVLMSND